MNEFIKGYVCAVCTLIRLNGGVDTVTKELYSAGIGNYTLLQLEKFGVDYSDLNILESNYSGLIG